MEDMSHKAMSSGKSECDWNVMPELLFEFNWKGEVLIKQQKI